MQIRLFLCAALALAAASPALAAERVITLTFGDTTTRFTAVELLARPDAASLTIPDDLSYRRAMTYRAVPLLSVLDIDALRIADTIEARASDGFVAQIPAELVRKGADGGSVPWIAIEDPAMPWPNVPGKTVSGGPFYLVWQNPERSKVASEQWPYALVALTGVENPIRRWPQLAVDPALPETASERQGQQSFISNCLPCHRLNGAGEGDMGPDLAQPMHVTDYMTPDGLRRLIRDPKSVRTWPGQQMVGFGRDQMPDAELDALVSFLAHTKRR